MWQENLVFPQVPCGFWRRFRQRWEEPLRMLEEVISISESFGSKATSPRFEDMDETFWHVLRSLHARTCLHARSVLALLSFGLVIPAWAQWRSCHESSTIARFIAERPEMAARFMHYSVANKLHLANTLDEIGHGEALPKPELSELERMGDAVQNGLRSTYRRKSKSKDNYAWSGLGSFKDIEERVYHDEEWTPRAEYISASGIVHSSPNAVRPVQVGSDKWAFPVGPTNSGLAGPADCTSLSIMMATESLLLNAKCSTEDGDKLKELTFKRTMIGAMCWLLDPDIFCDVCGGYRIGASPPDLIPMDERPEPCSCPSDEGVEEGTTETS